MIWSWNSIAKLLVPCEVLLATKLIFCLLSFPKCLFSYSVTLSFVIGCIFSSPITVFSFFLVMNWLSYYFYLLVFITISSRSIYSDICKLIYLGITCKVPFTLSNIELFIYIYTSTLYFLGLLSEKESVFGVICCFLIFFSLCLYRCVLSWKVLRLSNNHFLRLLLDARLPACLSLYGLYITWLLSVCFYLGSHIFTRTFISVPNTILCTGIFLLHVHVSLILASIKLLILPVKSCNLYRVISTSFLSMEVVSFLLILSYSAWKFYLSESSLMHLGYAEISSHVIFLTVIFCILYVYENLLPSLQLELFSMDRITILPSDSCSLCTLPLFQPSILTSDVTLNFSGECQHLMHMSCAQISESISFPCLRCSAESFICVQDTNNNSVIFNELHSSYANSEVSNTSNSLEESSSSSSIYDDKDVDLSVYLNSDQFNKSNISRTLRRLDGSSSSLFSVDDDVDNDVLSTDSAEWNYNNPSYESDISSF
uniref:RING-type domain-containing protein n=1 Tax=Schistosoma mansoni TaxID=6183 RepID=A0A3Q0KGV8_SCHMA